MHLRVRRRPAVLRSPLPGGIGRAGVVVGVSALCRLATLLPLILTAGCASIGAGETPWVLPAGRVRGGMQAVWGRADAVPSALVGAGALGVEAGVGRGVEVGVRVGADLDGFAGAGSVVKLRVPAGRRPVAAFAGGAVERSSYGVYQSEHHVRGTTVFGSVSVGGGSLVRPPRSYEALLPYATVSLAWIDARESGYAGESDADAYDDRFRGLSPGAAVGVTLRETVGPAVEVGVQGWKGRVVPVWSLRLRL